jgi:hypothetical protein
LRRCRLLTLLLFSSALRLRLWLRSRLRLLTWHWLRPWCSLLTWSSLLPRLRLWSRLHLRSLLSWHWLRSWCSLLTWLRLRSRLHLRSLLTRHWLRPRCGLLTRLRPWSFHRRSRRIAYALSLRLLSSITLRTLLCPSCLGLRTTSLRLNASVIPALLFSLTRLLLELTRLLLLNLATLLFQLSRLTISLSIASRGLCLQRVDLLLTLAILLVKGLTILVSHASSAHISIVSELLIPGLIRNPCDVHFLGYVSSESRPRCVTDEYGRVIQLLRNAWWQIDLATSPGRVKRGVSKWRQCQGIERRSH